MACYYNKNLMNRTFSVKSYKLYFSFDNILRGDITSCMSHRNGYVEGERRGGLRVQHPSPLPKYQDKFKE